MNMKRVVKYGLVIALGIIAICITALMMLSGTLPGGLPLSSSQLHTLTTAANRGDADACWALYLYYVHDDEKNAYWLRKAVEYGNLRAYTHLASRLEAQGREGRVKAFELLQRAAEQDFADAQGQLGEMYRDGKLVKQNLDQAEYWFRKAANNGSIRDMRELARLLLNTYQSCDALVEAYKWTVVLSMRVPYNSGFARDATYIQEEIVKKASEYSYGGDKIKQLANTQAEKLEKQIPPYSDPIEERNILLRHIREKYGD